MNRNTDHLIGRGSLEQRFDLGRLARQACPRSALALHETHGRDALALLAQSNKGRVAELIPTRYGRMLASPLAFYRGAAMLMAHDLALSPHCAVQVQLCGDAHLSNFGLFASPERRMLFGLNDFDETVLGPFDWDVRRLAASFVIASREQGFKKSAIEKIVHSLLDTYHQRMLDFAQMDTLDVWYHQMTSETLLKLGGASKVEKAAIEKARAKGSKQLVSDAVEWVDGPAGKEMRIKDTPPWVYHEAGATQREIGKFERGIQEFFIQYRSSLSADRQVLFDRYELMDVAVKVPGIGSVGTRCFVALFAADGHHPLFLQFKQARDSVLMKPLGLKAHPHNGQRIVDGQRLSQATSDVFLGWASNKAMGTEFYVRQLRDMKGSLDVTLFSESDMVDYAGACGYALARSQAKAGDPALIAGYIGKSEAFDEAITKHAFAYADQNEADYAALKKAVKSGVVKAATPEAGED
ncbi:MAG: DUF2252 domain-containing protein [Burkholderiales bacterium]|nr:MAG: DUF2252 domain-containing protein [Burkholderiales bacterium]